MAPFLFPELEPGYVPPRRRVVRQPSRDEIRARVRLSAPPSQPIVTGQRAPWTHNALCQCGQHDRYADRVRDT